VRDGLVRTYDVLALPTSSRWGGALIGAYVNERGAQYNLLDMIFSATDDGVLSLAAIRDADGRPVGALYVINDITVYGSDQAVFYKNGDPVVWDRGRELGMTNRIDRVPA